MRAMSQALEDATRRPWVALAALVGVALGILLPSLLATGIDAPATLTAAIVTLALAALVRLGHRFGAVAPGTSAASLAAGIEAFPVLPGRVTDRVHHPLRPRAPGLA